MNPYREASHCIAFYKIPKPSPRSECRPYTKVRDPWDIQTREHLSSSRGCNRAPKCSSPRARRQCSSSDRCPQRTRASQGLTSSLEELFQQCKFEHWQLEVKSASKVRAARTVLAISELVERFGLREQITITSSSREVLKAARELTPQLQLGLVAEYAWLDPLKVAAHYDCHLLALNWTLCTPERLLKAQKQGLHVSVWTVNEPALMRRLAYFGVDSIITDFPGIAVQTLRG